MNVQTHQAGWTYGCIEASEAKELHNHSGCSNSTDIPHKKSRTSSNQLTPLTLSHISATINGEEDQINAEKIPVISNKTASRKHVDVGQHKKSLQKDGSINQHCLYSRKVFVCGLNKFVSEKVAFDFFSQFGDVEAVEIVRHRRDRRSKGLGYVTFSDQEAANKVVETSEHVLQGKRITCAKYYPRLLELERDQYSEAPNKRALSERIGSWSAATAPETKQQNKGCLPSINESPCYSFNKESNCRSGLGLNIGNLIFRKYEARVAARNFIMFQ
jgi:RNA recognition motif-containing protein